MYQWSSFCIEVAVRPDVAATALRDRPWELDRSLSMLLMVYHALSEAYTSDNSFLQGISKQSGSSIRGCLFEPSV